MTAVDFELLFKLRLVVARHGEMDNARWWNTQQMLGRRGAAVLGRGLPKTHFFAQARVVFEVARNRCHEIFNPPGCMTLWNLPASLEERFQEHCQAWLDEPDKWATVFQKIATQSGTDLLGSLRDHGLIDEPQCAAVGRLRRSAENRAVPIPGTFQPDDDILAVMAAAFARGEPGALAIPYARLHDA